MVAVCNMQNIHVHKKFRNPHLSLVGTRMEQQHTFQKSASSGGKDDTILSVRFTLDLQQSHVGIGVRGGWLGVVGGYDVATDSGASKNEPLTVPAKPSNSPIVDKVALGVLKPLWPEKEFSPLNQEI